MFGGDSAMTIVIRAKNETKKVFAIYPTTTTGGSDDYSYQYISSQYVHDSLNNMKAEFTADSDLTVLAVSVNQTHTSVKRFVKGMRLDLTILMDSSGLRAS